MATLCAKLDRAHDAAGVKLTGHYGAGSTASAILKGLGIDKVKKDAPDEMTEPIASAFFGGRFDNSVVGSVPGPLWSYDISSAYPYQIASLPCLGCGQWEHTKRRKDLRAATMALVRYELAPLAQRAPWGPFPFRLTDGSIPYPRASGGGWLHSAEYLAGERLFPKHVRFREAWVYRTTCEHRPFHDVPRFYLERLKLGKEGPGLVLKFGTNAIYGKLAQTKGTRNGKLPRFHSLLWAGMVTAGTRAQLLDAMGTAKDPRNLLMVATDGIYSRERLTLPAPRDTGTFRLQDGSPNPKPLGGWEEKEAPRGLFLARPGIYFPLDPSEEDLQAVRARGLGRAVLYQNWRKIVAAWEAGEESVTLSNVVRFKGAKSSISVRSKGSEEESYERADDYGQWRPIVIGSSFEPLPKREPLKEKRRDFNPLYLRSFPGIMSAPYRPGMASLDAESIRAMERETLEQPDADYTEGEADG